MKRVLPAVLAMVVAATSAHAQQATNDGVKIHAPLNADAHGNPVTDPLRDPLRNYYGNTYVCYHGYNAVCAHWWNPDGTEQFFSVEVLPEGLVTMRTIEGPHTGFIANGQWCSHNARTALNRPMLDPYEDLNYSETNNNKNGCQPIVDAQPGDHWEKLHLDGNLTDEREMYALMPGHQ